MPEAGEMACRRCGQAGANVTTIYATDDHGHLFLKAVQCRPRCIMPGSARRPSPPPPAREPAPAAMFNATHAGYCMNCPRDVAPGDVIVRLPSGGISHFECSANDPPAPRERQRVRR